MIFALTIAITACGKKPKDFSTIKTGMTKNQVTMTAGNPDKQNDIGETSFWAYRDADRTVVFRKDTIYTIITSTEARLDSINSLIKKADDKIATGLDKMGNALDNTSTRIKRRMDSLNKK